MRGSLRFGTLALYRDSEEQEVRGDANEGANIYAPAGGLKIDKNNSGEFSIRRDEHALVGFQRAPRSGNPIRAEVDSSGLWKTTAPRESV